MPRVFGLGLHEACKLARWQEKKRQELERRLEDYRRRGELQE